MAIRDNNSNQDLSKHYKSKNARSLRQSQQYLNGLLVISNPVTPIVTTELFGQLVKLASYPLNFIN
jgi:hypothetical protein